MPSWIGPWEIAIVVVLVLLIFGPRKLPELGSSLGKSIRGFRKGMKESQDEVDQTVAEVKEAASVSDTPVNKAVSTVEPPAGAAAAESAAVGAAAVGAATGSTSTAGAASAGETPKCWGTWEDGNESCLQCGIAAQCAEAGLETPKL